MRPSFLLDAIACHVSKKFTDLVDCIIFLTGGSMPYVVAADLFDIFVALDENGVAIVGEDGAWS